MNMSLYKQLHSEWEANQELHRIALKEGYARYDFNLSGDIARGALRRRNASKGCLKARLITFFIGS